LATLQEQLKKARLDLNRARDIQKVKESYTKDTRYGKFDPTSDTGKTAIAELQAASKKVIEAQTYYDNLQAALAKQTAKEELTGAKKGVSEEVQAAKQGLTVEELRAQNQKVLDDAAAKKAAEQSTVTDQNQLNSYSQFRDTLADPANDALLKSVQADLKKNFPDIYSGGINGIKDWEKTQAAIETIYTKRGGLPVVLRGTDLRTFIANPTIPGFGSTTSTGNVPTINVSDPTEAAAYVRNVFKSVLQRDPTTDEITKYQDILNKAERKSPRKTVNGVTTGGLGSPIEFLTQEVQKLPEFSTKKKEKESLTAQSLQSIAKANGVILNDAQLSSYANEISNGKDINVIKNTIRNSAGLGMPDNIKKMLADGTDLETIYAPYKNTMASLLELDPRSIDINDTTLRTAIGDKELPIYEFRKILKKDPRWQYTNNARAEVSDKVLRVLQDFGFQG
jgi:hypothetical protein